MVNKRGSLSGNARVSIGFDKYNNETGNNMRKNAPRKRVGLIIVSSVLLVVCLTIGIAYVFSYYREKQEQERKDDFVWRARYELTFMQSDKSVNYLRIRDVRHEEKRLKIDCTVQLPDKKIKVWKDSTIHEVFCSIVAMNQERWDSVFHFLEVAETDVEISFLNQKLAPSHVIPYSQLRAIVADKQTMERGLSLFTEYKSREVLDYARQHFKHDRYFHPDSVTVDKDYIYLNLTFDDTYNLGKSYLDTLKINSHFTDNIGEMGSILDGMLSVSSRTERGFAFVYRGKKKHAVYQVGWNKERAYKLYKDYPGLIWQRGRKTNQVKTVLGK